MKVFKIILFIVASILLVSLYLYVVTDGKMVEEKFVENTEWTITHYGDPNGRQLMAYTIEGNEYGLALVDGGYIDEDSVINQLRDVINKHDGVVDYWIITHYDEDHAGALLKFIKEENITVKKLYGPGRPALEIAEKSAPWEDGNPIYAEILKTDIPNFNLVRRGYEEMIMGFSFRVISGYDPWMDEEIKTGLLNQSGLMFKIWGEETSMLFMADVQSNRIIQDVVKDYSDDLKSDYLQVAHHGNNTIEKSFYEKVKPSVVFFDAPNWLYNPAPEFNYGTNYTKPLFEEMGSTLYSFERSPHSVVMK